MFAECGESISTAPLEIQCISCVGHMTEIAASCRKPAMVDVFRKDEGSVEASQKTVDSGFRI